MFTQATEIGDMEAKIVSDFLVNKRYGSKLPGSAKDLVQLIKSQKAPIFTDQSRLEEIIGEIITANPKAVTDYRSGKSQALFFLVGCVKHELGNIDISKIQTELTRLLK
jgi:aspartyl-tRNA(Asn)/glutamyl-tRNA(Gln) amidotransferase subunit B